MQTTLPTGDSHGAHSMGPFSIYEQPKYKPNLTLTLTLTLILTLTLTLIQTLILILT